MIFEWEQSASQAASDGHSTLEADEVNKATASWTTPLGFRETMVSYLVRLATTPHDPQTKGILVRRALSLLRRMVGLSGWMDVTVKLNYFARALEQVSTSKILPHQV